MAIPKSAFGFPMGLTAYLGTLLKVYIGKIGVGNVAFFKTPHTNALRLLHIFIKVNILLQSLKPSKIHVTTSKNRTFCFGVDCCAVPIAE